MLAAQSNFIPRAAQMAKACVKTLIVYPQELLASQSSEDFRVALCLPSQPRQPFGYLVQSFSALVY